MAEPSLADLVAVAGLKPDYIDARGNAVQVDEDSLRELLGAMGLPAWTQADIGRSYQEVVDRPWQRLLPPAVVAVDGEQPIRVRLNVPEALAERSVAWRVVDEGGTVVASGQVQCRCLPVLERRTVADEAIAARALSPGVRLAYGYHWLYARLGADRPERAMAIAIAPERGYLPEDAGAGSKAWGFTTQVYSLWRAGGWGIGDFTDLGRLLENAAGAGASLVGVNPLHAEFPADWNHFSPYSPSSRLFPNVLYVDVERVPEFAQCHAARARVADPEFRARLQAAQSAELVDYRAVWSAKLEVLEPLFQTFKAQHLGHDVDPRGRAFEAYRREMGRALTDFATFHALHEWYFGADPSRWDWRSWHAEHQDPDSDAVRHFQETHHDRVLFYSYLHWLADEQLAAAQASARSAGMPLGVFADLAVGAEVGAAEAWTRPDIYATGATVGAPPDILGPRGQNWGLAPMNPVVVQQRGYGPFVELLRANMRHAGALRIDHAMSLMRLFWIPLNRSPAEGAYVLYPFQDLVRLVALESWRHGCVVVGEDLGTVPEGFRPAVHAAGIQSTAVMVFQMDESGAFLPAESYTPAAAVTATTHDLPTLAGWWQGHDIELRQRYDLYPDPAMHEQDAAQRPQEKRSLLCRIGEAGLLPEGRDPDGELPAELPRDLFLAIHRFLARSPCRLVLVQVEDANFQIDPVNVPGTGWDPPNWRRRHAHSVDALFDQPWVGELIRMLAAERPRGS